MPARVGAFSAALSLVGRNFQSPPRPSPGRRAELVLLRQGVDIALEYFNFGTRDEIPQLTRKAKKWSEKYFQGYHHAAQRPTGLVKKYPSIFNLNIEPYFRLDPAAVMASSPTHADVQSSNAKDYERAERATMNTEAFPKFIEPTLASAAELDEITDLRPRLPQQQGKSKPDMRVDAAMLRGSGLMESLPDFLGQLARANLETETELAEKAEGSGFELDDETAAKQPHIALDVFAGLIEPQQRRRIILPGGDDDHDADHSANETDASSSTAASLRAISLKKRKADEMSEVDEAEESANKLRIACPGPQSPTLSTHSNSSSSSGGPSRIIKIKVVKSSSGESRAGSSRPSTSGSDGSSLSAAAPVTPRKIKIKVKKLHSATSSPKSSPEQSTSVVSTPRKIKIKLKTSSSTSSSTQASPSPSPSASRASTPIIIRIKRKPSPPTPATTSAK